MIYSKYIMSWVNEDNRAADFIDGMSLAELEEYGVDAIDSIIESMNLQHSEEQVLKDTYKAVFQEELTKLTDTTQFQMRNYLFTIEGIADKPQSIAA